MYTFVVAILVSVVVCVAIGQLIENEDGLERVYHAFIGLLGGFMIGLLVGLVVAASIGATKPVVPVVSEKHQLATLTDAAGIDGGFFLGIGSIDTQVRVYYYEVTPDGYQLHWKDETSPDVYIAQENRTDGELDVVTNQFQNASDGNWGIRPNTRKYIFHVPNGTVAPCFRLNAGKPSTCPAS